MIAGQGATYSAWTPGLLRGLAQNRSVIAFDNQVLLCTAVQLCGCTAAAAVRLCCWVLLYASVHVSCTLAHSPRSHHLQQQLHSQVPLMHNMNMH